MRVAWTREEREFLKENYRRLSCKECVRELNERFGNGRSAKSVGQQVCRKLRSVVTRRRGEHRQRLDREGYALWDRGWTDWRIAKRIDCCRVTVLNWRKRERLPPNAPLGSEDRYVCFPGLIERREILVTLHAEGLADSQVAQSLGITERAARCRRLRAGLPCNRKEKCA